MRGVYIRNVIKRPSIRGEPKPNEELNPTHLKFWRTLISFPQRLALHWNSVVKSASANPLALGRSDRLPTFRPSSSRPIFSSSSPTTSSVRPGLVGFPSAPDAQLIAAEDWP